MADLPSFKSKLNDLEVAQNKPLTEALMTKIGSNINAFIDHDEADDIEIAQIQSDLTILTARVNDADNVVTLFNQSLFTFTDLSWALTESPNLPPRTLVQEKTLNVFTTYRLILYNFANGLPPTQPPTTIYTYDSTIPSDSSHFYTLTWEPTATQWVFTLKIYDAVSV